MFKIPPFGLSSVFYTSCAKKEPYLFIGKTHKFKNSLNLMTLVFDPVCSQIQHVSIKASIHMITSNGVKLKIKNQLMFLKKRVYRNYNYNFNQKLKSTFDYLLDVIYIYY